ncbi:MAG: Rpn family recombination-promoting nuclease/putative transposase [Catonella sp.]|uniref:Rpn family recombination-promoting nuclease/putative transposase n=1 Tax=Catonella sp. TaxID=2382125 RepID=UPI003FA02D57
MKEKDIAEKILLSFNDVFADVVNGTIFDGRDVVKSEDLEEAGTVTQFKDDENVHHEQLRDVAKLWKKNGVIFSFIGVENQSVPDEDLILRVCAYDGVTYKNQQGRAEIYPVFTIVIYWGKTKWKAPISLKERITCPTELEGLISDHKFKLVEMARLTDEEIERYKGDFNFIAGIMAKEENYEPNQEEIRHPDEVLDLLSLLTNDERFAEAKSEVKSMKKEGGTVDMCGFLDKIENRGIEKGIEKGIEQGEEIATLNIAKKLKESKAALKYIMEITGLTKEQVESL